MDSAGRQAQIGRLIKAFGRSIFAVSGWIGVLYLWADIEGLPQALEGPRDALRGAMGLISLETALVWFSGALVIWIVWRDLRPVLPEKWRQRLGIKLPANPITPLVAPRVVERDRKWAEAVALLATGSWDAEPWSGEDGYTRASLGNSYMRQAAIDGKIRAWGREYPNSGAYLPLEPSYWMAHTIDFMELFKEGASTSASGYSRDAVFHDIMVSSVEVEDFAASLRKAK